jgi:hypothetical protein
VLCAVLPATREGATPGLEELYLTTMDALERLTPGDPLYLVQGAGGGRAGVAPGECGVCVGVGGWCGCLAPLGGGGCAAERVWHGLVGCVWVVWVGCGVVGGW